MPVTLTYGKETVILPACPAELQTQISNMLPDIIARWEHVLSCDFTRQISGGNVTETATCTNQDQPLNTVLNWSNDVV